MVRHPSYFFDASPEHALVNPDNLHILVDHVKCAAFELPFSGADAFGTVDVQEVLAILRENGLVHRSGDPESDEPGQWHWTSESYPADAVSLRSITSDNFVIVDVGAGAKVIGETDFTSGPTTLHPKAIYIVEGRLYQVEALDYDHRKAFVRDVDCDYYTDGHLVLEGDGARHGRRRTARWPRHGDVHVSSRVVGFKKIKFYTNENVGSGELDLPEQQMHTTGYWLSVPRPAMQALPWSKDDKRDGVVGLGFAMKNVATLLLMCDVPRRGRGLRAGRRRRRRDRARSADARPFPRASATSRASTSTTPFPAASASRRRCTACTRSCSTARASSSPAATCDHGCPTCVGPIGETGPRAKTVALALLQTLLTGHRPEAAAIRRTAAASARDGRALLMKPSLADRLRAVVGPSAVPRVHPDALGRRRRAVRGDGLPARSTPMAGDGRVARAHRAAAVLGGVVDERADGLCIVVDRRYDADMRHGRHRVGDIVGDAAARPKTA